ncbi:ankyrin repeat protein, putative [Trichomonas vaginalis G3]|uniref:Ankyrin repeat protein, putative n=1 Tax=Trichomonas vaginalis (strain ATCC PRA-98 / G3) TaxID=412133 RepID=A2E2P8_TRIV3|nr:spectrin binding [Trichomonas vaginalis G3]EAY13076.1 ankyrin repeat protein, putative [Trichomonas vaginalis G3]KAI5548264.1 spectrin binding [Trichomonas vaginalis G3]|eukprot:XP_001325299.1 ankyrin repeat protein [Trichomonas vaginalis G3]
MNIQMLVYLISNGLSFDNSHSNRYFPLHAAARTSLPELVMYVMDNSLIPVNQPDLTNDNSTALLESSIHGFTRVVVWLLEHGGDPHVLRKRDQMTPLHFAARNGDLKMMNAFIEYKAKPMPISKKGKTPLHYAAEQGSKDMLLILTKNKPNLNVTPEGKETPLDIAVRKSDGNFVSALLARGIDPNPVHDKILPPLYVAVKENMEDIVAMLIMAGANVNSYASDGKKLRTPLHAACSKGLVDLTRFLIENGADKDAKDSDGKKPNEITKKKEIKQLFI